MSPEVGLTGLLPKRIPATSVFRENQIRDIAFSKPLILTDYR